MLYAGVDGAIVPADAPLHHQVIPRASHWARATRSLSPSARHGTPHVCGAATSSPSARIQTHALGIDCAWKTRACITSVNNFTPIACWPPPSLLCPDCALAASISPPGTPLAFQRFAWRVGGWVGGFPQTSLVRGWPPHLAPSLWMVGDSIFPGQSTAAVALGGLRVACARRRSAPTPS